MARTFLTPDPVDGWPSIAVPPLQKILAAAGHVPVVAEPALDTWPEFREYASMKYGTELDDDLITMIEGLIELRRDRRYGRKLG